MSSSNVNHAYARVVRFIMYRARGEEPNAAARVGALLPKRLNVVFDAGVDLAGVLERYHASGDTNSYVETSLTMEDVDVLAPFDATSSSKILAVGKNYREHVGEVDATLPGISREDVPSWPIIFTKASSAVIANGDEIDVHGREDVDYEGELACVIGRRAKNVDESVGEDAIVRAYVAGWTVANDVTARDLQKQHQQWFLGKSCDTFCPCGPWIACAVDGTPPSGETTLATYVNGEERQRVKISQMIFSVATLIATISKYQTLNPGDVILTGTPKGVGAGQKPRATYLKSGDVVDIEIDGIGRLSNRVK